MVELKSLLETVANYPYEARQERLAAIEALGLRLVEKGDALVQGHRILGKGTRGLVVAAEYKGGLVAVKIRRGDSVKNSLSYEANVLKLVNAVGIGPKLYTSTTDMLIMELVEGPFLCRHKEMNDQQLERCVRSALLQANKLDEIGLDHGELSRAQHHVAFSPAGAVIVDFESSSVARRQHNYNSLYSYFFVKKGELQERVAGLKNEFLFPHRSTRPKPVWADSSLPF